MSPPATPTAAAHGASGSDPSEGGLFGFEVPGLEVVARVHPPADGVAGGDFYDIVRVGQPDEADGRWAVVIGEVRGRGPEAAAAAASARRHLRDAGRDGLAPAEMLRSLNDTLLGTTRERDELLDPRFCTAAVAVFESAGDGARPGGRGARVTLAVAGHPAPLVLRRHGGVEVVESPGILLGVVEATFVEDRSLVLGPGDTLILRTDGVTEPQSNGQSFDEEELKAVLSRCAGFTADVLAERIETAARAFVEDDPRDDLAIIVIRVPEAMGTATLVSADLPSDVTAPGRARRIVAASLAARGLEDLVEPAVLLTSEVVTNAVVHGGGHARIGVEHDLAGVRVSVSDASDQRPRRLDLGVDATSGRGVQLLDQLANRWGVDAHKPRGKTVWFELDARPA